MGMRHIQLLLSSISLCACSPPSEQATQAAPEPTLLEAQSSLDGTATVEHLMTTLIAPNAEILWNAVSYIATAEGVTETIPESDADWSRLRDSANALIDAGAQLMDTNREVLTSAFDPATANFQLTPDEIKQMLSDDPAPWLSYAEQLQDTTRMTLQAIELRDVMGLQEFGAEINEACEGCHASYWYRPPGSMVPR